MSNQILKTLFSDNFNPHHEELVTIAMFSCSVRYNLWFFIYVRIFNSTYIPNCAKTHKDPNEVLRHNQTQDW